MATNKPVLELGREYPPPGEEQDIDRVIRLSDEILRLGKPPVLRGQHAKGTGAVRARFEVFEGRPEETKVGLFKDTRTYDAIVRFSNGIGRVQPDALKDARGMAIKVLGVEGPRDFDEERDHASQDFVMINFPVFAFRDAAQYASFMALKRRFMGLVGPSGNQVAQVLFFLPWHLEQFWNIGRKIRRTSTSPLTEDYWSMSAYRLGSRAIKFMAKYDREMNPDDQPAASPGVSPPDDFLSRVLADHLREREARFDFLVQFQADPRAMPVEDPTVEWDEDVSRPVKVATVIIDRCDLSTDEARQFHESVEAMSFNPWHSLIEHRPLGGINRLRKAVYQSNARMRRETGPPS
jgi:hypothetical protein